MAEPNTEVVTPGVTTADSAPTAKTFTQEEVDRLIDKRIAKLKNAEELLKSQLAEQFSTTAQLQAELKKYQTQHEALNNSLKEYQTKERDSVLEKVFIGLNGKKDTFSDFKNFIKQDEIETAFNDAKPDEALNKIFKPILEKYKHVFLDNTVPGADPVHVQTNSSDKKPEFETAMQAAMKSMNLVKK